MTGPTDDLRAPSEAIQHEHRSAALPVPDRLRCSAGDVLVTCYGEPVPPLAS